MKHGKKYVDSLKLIDKSKNYEASEAIALCVQTGKAKFDETVEVHVSHILKSLNIKWRDHRQELWQLRNDGTRTRDELITMVPAGIDRDH